VSDVTRVLDRVQQGHPKATEELLPLVYEELRKLAAHKMSNERPGQTLQPTALVHEAWLRLVGPDDQHWDSRGHFFAAAAEAMRRILIERARAKARFRHGGHLERVDIDHVTVASEDADETVLAIHEALDRLTAQAPLDAEVVKMRYFIGLRHAEIARALGVSEATVRRHWSFARAWLYAELKAQLQR
jgi:RNA polymerase sigma factor (TIGR02999 family)